MANPFELPAPDDTIERVHELARDLAYGAAHGLWHSRIQWQVLLNPEISHIAKVFTENLTTKWYKKYPSEFLLLSFGYFSALNDESGRSTYLLTEKAFALLQKPTAPPDIFISYRRSESSAFGLLVEARLRLAVNPNPFVDKNLTAGEEWNRELEEKIRHSRYFVLLVGKTTLQSPYVLQELEWAVDAGCRIISIWHGCKMDSTAPDVLQSRHALTVDAESAFGYEIAVNQLLNSMGYSTY